MKSLPIQEQETIITRNRADVNKVDIYSSDSRVIPKLLKHFPDCKKITNPYYGGIVAVELTTDGSFLQKSRLLFPKYQGKILDEESCAREHSTDLEIDPDSMSEVESE